MKTITVGSLLAILLALPLSASAHAHAVYKIGDSTYEIVIGSLNEPIAVDDKTGLDLRLMKCVRPTCAATRSADGKMDGPAAGTPVLDASESLKFEISAGSVKKTMDIAPQYGKPGAYSAPFYLTVPTTYTYRIFGTLNDTEVDLSFSCAAEATHSDTDTESQEVAPGVVLLSKGGAFGCPKDKTTLGFPEKAESLHALSMENNSTNTLAMAALVFGLIGMVTGAYSIVLKK